ncbi:MAG: SprT-like domain-containing protein [Bacteriovoracaceae bacterium]|nr:SprT-like domain-containing protein [Bacteriovoracaceae bacterium]
MKLYSDTIATFLGHAERMAREILSKECQIDVGRTRFTIGRTTWPLSIVCFEDDSRWGYFESQFYQIGINSKLVGTIKDSVLRDLIRHELAHYLAFIFYPHTKSAHGEEFKLICKKYHWPETVAAASGDLPSLIHVGDMKSEAIIEKVKKLLSLASSDNPHEAELATLKANQLILKYHIEKSDLQDSKEFCVSTLMESSKKNSLMLAIYEILTHFLVKPLLFYGRGCVRLEAAGDREQIKLAHYITDYLVLELESLWKSESKRLDLKGLRAKNSFYVGIAKGFSEKLTQSRTQFTPVESKGLIKVEGQLKAQFDKFIGGLSSSTSGQVLDSKALESGKQKGRDLSIRSAIKSTEKVYRLS